MKKENLPQLNPLQLPTDNTDTFEAINESSQFFPVIQDMLSIEKVKADSLKDKHEIEKLKIAFQEKELATNKELALKSIEVNAKIIERTSADKKQITYRYIFLGMLVIFGVFATVIYSIAINRTDLLPKSEDIKSIAMYAISMFASYLIGKNKLHAKLLNSKKKRRSK